MRMYDLILKKRNGHELETEEINFIIKNYTEGGIPDYQISALLMAIFFQKMNQRETLDLTMAMAKSGDMLDLSGVEGIKVDKHSTGGVGDKTTLVLGPMVASLGIPVAKMSGRGLGHTGGTIDKLESFRNFSVEMDKDDFIDRVNKIKLAVCGQSVNLAPADKKLYSLRDVTATVDNISLIASSIMSKKLAAGSEAIVLDVKCGDGAFMKDKASAFELAREMVAIGCGAGRKTLAVITDMDQPLGYAVGNVLEVMEAIDTLRGRGPADLLELCLTLGSYMVLFSEMSESIEEARAMLMDTINKGTALSKFAEFIEAQSGDTEPIYSYEKFQKARYCIPVLSRYQGFINKIHTQDVGLIAMELGAGRASKEDVIDLSAGIVLNKKRGDFVSQGEPIGYLHSNDEGKGLSAVKKLMNCYEISDTSTSSIPLIYGIIK